MPTVRISDEVWRELQLRAVGFKDTPDSTLRRVLKIDTESSPHGETVFDLMVKYLGKGDKAALAEVYRRFREFGWIQTPNLADPERMETHRRRSEAAFRAVQTKRKKYRTWPTRKGDHK